MREVKSHVEYRIRSEGFQRVAVKITYESGQEVIREETHEGLYRYVRYGETPDDWTIHPVANDRVGLKRVD
jgi:hypothetical protein